LTTNQRFFYQNDKEVMRLNKKAILLILLVVFAALAYGIVGYSKAPVFVEKVGFAGAPSIVQMSDDGVEPEGKELDGPGMPT
jgi:hypothetical protein